jgi:ABC-2 type transport system permease protein
MINPRVVGALVLRYLFLYSRTWVRLGELVFWPVMELMVWGFLSAFLLGEAGDGLPMIMGYLLGAMLLWDVLFRAQQGVAISFLEDVWTNNLLNIFVAPVRQSEYLAATFAVGALRITVTVTVIAVVSALAYAFNVFVLGWYLLPFFANLMVFGWALGMVSTALILRWGQAAEALAWAVPFMVQPVAAVFYPVSAMPGWLQVVAWGLPCSHVFEGMREVIDTGRMPIGMLAAAAGLNAIWLAAAGAVYLWVFRYVRRHGLVSKVVSR